MHFDPEYENYDGLQIVQNHSNLRGFRGGFHIIPAPN
jgi:hypothetical protein